MDFVVFARWKRRCTGSYICPGHDSQGIKLVASGVVASVASVWVGRSLKAGANSFLATETCMRKSSHSIVIGLKKCVDVFQFATAIIYVIHWSAHCCRSLIAKTPFCCLCPTISDDIKQFLTWGVLISNNFSRGQLSKYPLGWYSEQCIYISSKNEGPFIHSFI